MFERWSDDSRRALGFAQDHAHRAGQYYIGLDHLLIGIIDVGDAEVDTALRGRSQQVRAVAVERLKQRRKPTEGTLPVFPVLADIIEKARREAERRKEELRPVHLLRSLAGSGQRAVTRPLKAVGRDADELAEEPEMPVPEDIAIPAEMEKMRDEMARLRAELEEMRRREPGD